MPETSRKTAVQSEISISPTSSEFISDPNSGDDYYREETGDSLQIYLRQINKIPLLGQASQKQLIHKIDLAIVAYRRELYQLGFILLEHARILEKIHDKDTNLNYDFLPSSLENRKNALLELPAWHQEIKDLYRQSHDAWHNKTKNREALRARAPACLLKYEVVYDHLQEWHKVIVEYLALAAPKLRKPESAALSDINPDKIPYLEEKFLMPLEEFFPLFKRIREKYAQLKALHGKMLESNLRLAVCIAQRYRNKGLPINDLIQEANLGLMRAVEKFDFRLGNRFSTYATWWIKQTVSRAIAEQSRVIRIPVHMINTIISMNHVEQLFMQMHGREPNVKELSAALEIPTSRISAIRKMARQAISLQAPVGDSNDGSVLQDILASDSTGDDPIQGISQKVLKQKVYEVLATLPEREQQIIIMRFGLMGYSPMTLIKVSEHFDLTRERIRQLEIKILEKLRSPEKRKFFDGCLYS
ncbi:MAG: sigma-70 family RNA polymerase sigma factor [Victivallaceae bacterium]|nr:sigma-70 family RNA polymerase sigma factor [Victivallaceae bacterium]